MAAVAATCSRRSNRSRASGDSEVGNSIRITPGMVWVLTGKAAVAEHLDHLVVLGQHLGIEHLDADLVGRLGELAEQDRAEPIALHGVGDLQGHLRPLGMIGLALEAGVADHPAVGAGGGDQPVAAVVVDLGGPLDGLLQVGEAGEEAQPAALVGQALQQLLDRGRVGAPGRPHVHGRAVPQRRRRPPDARDRWSLPSLLVEPDFDDPGHTAGQQGGQLAAGRVGGAGELARSRRGPSSGTGWARPVRPPAGPPGPGRCPRRCGRAPPAGPAWPRCRRPGGPEQPGWT